MRATLDIHRHEGALGERFLALETPSGTQGSSMEEINVPEGALFISVHLTNPATRGFHEAKGVAVHIVSPTGVAYGLTEQRPTPGQDSDAIIVSMTTSAGQIIYVSKPEAGQWAVQISAGQEIPFCCEVRVLPSQYLEEGAGKTALFQEHALAFAKALPRTRIAERIYDVARTPASASDGTVATQDDDCAGCQAESLLPWIAIGTAALIAGGAAFLIFLSPLCFNPVAAAAGGLLVVIGLVIHVDLITSMLVNLVDVLVNPESYPLVFTRLAFGTCQLAGRC